MEELLSKTFYFDLFLFMLTYLINFNIQIEEFCLHFSHQISTLYNSRFNKQIAHVKHLY